MKLYAWQPKGHGETSFFVLAENEYQAQKAELILTGFIWDESENGGG